MENERLFVSGSEDNELPPNIRVRHDLTTSDIRDLVQLHGILYNAEYGWDQSFADYVAEPLTEFAKLKSNRERIWLVEHDGKLAGSIAIVEASQELAQLRWLLLAPQIRGRGIGRWLVSEAIRFSRGCGYTKVFLWTEQQLQNAARLYRSFGFELLEEKSELLWGAVVKVQRYELRLLD